MKEIDDLVYIDSDGVRIEYDARITGTTIVFPDPLYEPFIFFNSTLRSSNKNGIVYSSARHSRDLCIALFGDKSDSFKGDFKTLPVELLLVAEDHNPSTTPGRCNPFKEKLHSTMGFYRFENTAELSKVNRSRIINPPGIPPRGMIDFVRRKYINYPHDAAL